MGFRALTFGGIEALGSVEVILVGFDMGVWARKPNILIQPSFPTYHHPIPKTNLFWSISFYLPVKEYQLFVRFTVNSNGRCTAPSAFSGAVSCRAELLPMADPATRETNV